MIVQISNGTVFFGANDVFENIDFTVNENERIALVGRNGSGKTTLLKVLTGECELSSGQVIRSGKTVISYLKQNALAQSEKTLRETFDEVFAKILETEKQMEEVSEELKTNHDEKLIARYARLEEDYRYLGGYTYRSEMLTVLHGFGFRDEDLDRPVSSFSGGEKTKIAFASLLLAKPDLLLLDEPTNHLDLSTIEWLEGYLAKYKKAMILVSHDRTFLDHCVNVVYELEYGSIRRYPGNYTAFVEQKKNDFIRQESAYKRQQKDIKRLEELIEKFRYKKNKAAFAQSKIKYLERMERIEDPKKADTKAFKARFECQVRGGRNVLSLENFKVGYDHPLAEVTLNVMRGDRICIMGDNGTGKSTLLKTIVGLLKPLDGYKDYIDTKVKEQLIEQKEEKPEVPLKQLKQKPKYNIKKLENEISLMEDILEDKRALRYEPEYYQDMKKMAELDDEIDEIHNQIQALEEKWEEAMKEEEEKAKQEV